MNMRVGVKRGGTDHARTCGIPAAFPKRPKDANPACVHPGPTQPWRLKVPVRQWESPDPGKAGPDKAARMEFTSGTVGAPNPNKANRAATECRTKNLGCLTVCARRPMRSFMFYLTGTSMGAPLSFTRNTTNFAGWVLLALRPMT